jgi:hypothetical protein
MALTHRSDGPLVSGRHHSGDRGLGVLGSSVPTGGVHGGSYLAQAVALYGLAGNEVRGLITAPPTGLTYFWADESGAFEAEGADGVYTWQFRLIVDGVTHPADDGFGAGIWRVELVFGTSGQASGSASLDPIVATGSAQSAPAGAATGSASFDPIVATGSASPAGPSGEATGSASLAAITATGSATGDSLAPGVASGSASLAPIVAIGSASSGGTSLESVEARSAIALEAADRSPITQAIVSRGAIVQTIAAPSPIRQKIEAQSPIPGDN